MLHFSIGIGRPEATAPGPLSNGKENQDFSISFGKIGDDF